MNIDLDAIEKHRAFLERAHRMSCSDPDDPKRSTTYGESAKAIAFLLAYARDLEARIGRVEALAVASEPFKFHGSYTSSGIVLANDILAALTATDTP